ncbi:MAG: ATP-binding cassette domain-containing protein [Candidatus Nanopelagicales bacterium]
MSATRPAVDLLVEGLSVVYPNGHAALKDASFSLSGGTICALVGVNGSGKSTLFNAIMGTVPASAGRVSVGGAPVSKDFAQEIGADGHSPDAPGAVRLAKRYLTETGEDS